MSHPSDEVTVSGVHAFDLEHDGLPGAICAYLIEEPEPTLIDPGPSTCLDALQAGLEGAGFELEDLRHLLLTHVHLDHAGASGHLVARCPKLTVHIHEDAAPHLVDPRKLEASTRRTFGELHDRLWGAVEPIPENRIRGWALGISSPLPRIRPLPTPGHIGHHVAWEAEKVGVLFAGDSLGIILHPDAPTHPATPPPGVNLPDWRRTLDETLASVEVEAFAVTHFGLQPDLHARRDMLREELEVLARRVHRALKRSGPGEPDEAEESEIAAFHAETLERLEGLLPEGRAEHYFENFSPRADWEGMRFHLARNPGVLPERKA